MAKGKKINNIAADLPSIDWPVFLVIEQKERKIKEEAVEGGGVNGSCTESILLYLLP